MKILKFYSNTCFPCKQQGKILEKLNVEVENIDVWDENSEDIVEQYNITNIPTLVILDDDGNAIQRFSGLTSQDTLEAFIEEYNGEKESKQTDNS